MTKILPREKNIWGGGGGGGGGLKLNSWIREAEFREFVKLNSVNSWSWIREFMKLNSWSWIREVEFVNSWSRIREFVKLKSRIREIEIVNSWSWNLELMKLKCHCRSFILWCNGLLQCIVIRKPMITEVSSRNMQMSQLNVDVLVRLASFARRLLKNLLSSLLLVAKFPRLT